MKIVVFGPEKRVGAWEGDVIVDLSHAHARLLRESGGDAGRTIPASLLAFIEAGAPALEAARSAIDHAKSAPSSDGGTTIRHRATDVQLHAPWPGKRIACAGGNFAAHSYGMMLNRGITDVTMETHVQRIRDEGFWGFWKDIAEVAGRSGEIPFPKRTTYLDYEGEVAIVVGKRGKDIRAGEIGDYVWGVTLAVDWSSRTQARGTRGVSFNLQKTFDMSASVGPCIVVRELDPANVDIQTHVDGELRQNYNSKDMVFSFGEVLEFLSRDLTFVPGDMIMGGTGPGTAQDSTPPNPDGTRSLERFLRIGQRVDVSSPAIGSLSSRIVAP